MTKKDALAMLFDTHVLWTPKAGQELVTALKLDPAKFPVRTYRANTGEPKGLYVGGLGKNAKVQGYASHDLVADIAHYLGLDTPGFFGRGSQQRADADAIVAYIKKAA